MLEKNKNSFIILAFLFLILGIQKCLSVSIRDEMLLTDEEREGFERFKAKAIPMITTEYMKKDIVLMKYYKYCKMDETKAMDQLRDNLKWRLDLGFETLTDDEFNQYLRDYPISKYDGITGVVVAFMPAQYWDFAKASTSPESSKKFMQYAYALVESIYEKGVSRLGNKTVSGYIFFADVYNMDFAKSICPDCINMMKEILITIESRWPLGMQQVFIVNAQAFMSPAIKLLKTSVSKYIQEVTYIADDDDTVWLPEVLKVSTEQSLPPELYIKSRAPQSETGQQGAPPTAMLGGILAGAGGAMKGGMKGSEPVSEAKKESRIKGMKKKAKKAGKKKQKDSDDDDDD